MSKCGSSVVKTLLTNTFQTLPDIRSGAVKNFTRPNNILQDQKKKTNKLNDSILEFLYTIQHWVKNSSAARHIRTYILW